ncbi:PREDICTED: spidroin-2-like [Dipodomys ordii]|uniref:Spidroin-2-like n=1 Tax=Dipodomys ordii TaxID=10020 RepID=A0A1S3G7B3_DIPOR|nr:PREDICTED: spidroin-2-like [Dipodomys ordii]
MAVSVPVAQGEDPPQGLGRTYPVPEGAASSNPRAETASAAQRLGCARGRGVDYTSRNASGRGGVWERPPGPGQACAGVLGSGEAGPRGCQLWPGGARAGWRWPLAQRRSRVGSRCAASSWAGRVEASAGRGDPGRDASNRRGHGRGATESVHRGLGELGNDEDPKGLKINSNIILEKMGINISVLMGANIASEVAGKKFYETTISEPPRGDMEVSPACSPPSLLSPVLLEWNPGLGACSTPELPQPVPHTVCGGPGGGRVMCRTILCL